MSKMLNEKKTDLITRAEDILNKAKEEKRELSDEEIAEIQQIKADIEKIKTTIGLEEDIAREQETVKDDPKKEEEKVDTDKEKELQETRAFENYVRGFVMHERAGELTKTDNGAVIPSTIANKIIKKVYDVCPVLEKSEKYNVKGTLNIPYYDTESSAINVAYSEEFTPLVSSNGKFASIALTGYLAGALSKISKSLINNAQFNITDFVVTQMGEDIARFIEHELLIGTTGKVEGLSTVKIEVESSAADSIKADDLIDLQDSIKAQFNNSAFWIMHPTTLTALRKLKDNNGRYLLQDDITAAFGKTLLGKTVYPSDNMPKIGEDGAVIYYGDMSCLATKFNENINIQILREKYADEHADGVIGWFEFDSKVQNAQGIAKLVMKSA